VIVDPAQFRELLERLDEVERKKTLVSVFEEEKSMSELSAEEFARVIRKAMLE
jgi:tetrahydromethanopterin S-methyltransferase subunit G